MEIKLIVLLYNVREFELVQGIMFALGYKWFNRDSYASNMDCTKLLSIDYLPIGFDFEDGLTVEIWDDGELDWGNELTPSDITVLEFEEFLDYIDKHEMRA